MNKTNYLIIGTGACLLAGWALYQYASSGNQTIRFPGSDTHSPATETDKVQDYVNSPGFIGFFLSHNNQSNTKERCFITSVGDEKHDSRLFTAFRCSDHAQIGSAIVHFYDTDPSDGKFKNKVYSTQKEKDLQYPESTTKVPFIQLDGLYDATEGSNRDIRSVLIKAIQQWSPEKFQGRIRARAKNDSHTFYRELGFRSIISDVNAHLAKESPKTTSADTSNLQSQLMYLPQNSAQEWVAHVKRHPLTKPQ